MKNVKEVWLAYPEGKQNNTSLKRELSVFRRERFRARVGSTITKRQCESYLQGSKPNKEITGYTIVSHLMSTE